MHVTEDNIFKLSSSAVLYTCIRFVKIYDGLIVCVSVLIYNCRATLVKNGKKDIT